ncbi:MAG: zinc ribbon domain-containing protein [Lachnospiraceae bacterium]|nr:zinc ribbon domain-containing protein [Lachnospiraceae bacterium]
MEMKICQSCGMPMTEEQYGTNKDGSGNHKYCCYCFKDGEFTAQRTMEEMADFCAPIEVEGGRCKTVEEAKAVLMSYFPTLERWKAQ